MSRRKEFEKIASGARRPALYLQVDYTGGSSRNGAPAGEVAALVGRARDLELDVRGLMTVAAPDRGPGALGLRRVGGAGARSRACRVFDGHERRPGGGLRNGHERGAHRSRALRGAGRRGGPLT